MTPMFTTPPECDKPDECRFVAGPVSSTLMSYSTEYDRAGNALQSTGESFQYWRCNTCGKMWRETIAAQNSDA